jgi:hypothetical protein
MIINDNKKDLRRKNQFICHKLASDKSALAMMYGRGAEPQPNATACWKIVMVCAHCRAMDMQCQS